ncbi:MAG: hypothetical protein ACRDY7_16905 [Acidimicrobiia bacterium]
MAAAVEVQHLTKRFGTVVAVDDLSFVVHELTEECSNLEDVFLELTATQGGQQ